MVSSKQIKRFEKFIDLIHLLRTKCKGRDCHKKFHTYISYFNEESIQFLAECIRNALDPSTFKRLKTKHKKKIIAQIKPYKKDIHKVIKPGLSSQQRKKVFQKGGAWFLPILTAIITPLISSLISSAQKRQ